MEKQRKISIVSLLIAILLIVTITIGTSYSLWTTSVQQESTNTIDVGCFRIDFSDEGFGYGGNINLEKAYPISNDKGKALVPYRFSISNQCSVASSYNVILETLNSSTMDESKLDVYFNDTSIKHYSSNVVDGLSEDAKNGMNLTRGYLAAGETITYNLKVWIDYDVTTDTPNIQGKIWNGRVVVNSEATFTKPSFTNKVIGEDNVTLDIDTKNDKTVQTLECFYGNERVQNEVGTAVGISKCQYPLNAEYAKFKVTYTDGSSDSSYPKQLIKYLIKDGVEYFKTGNWYSTTTLEDGFVKVVLTAVDESSTYYINDPFDLHEYYAMYIDESVNIISKNSSSMFGLFASDSGYYSGNPVYNAFLNPYYNSATSTVMGDTITRNTFVLPFTSAYHFIAQDTNSGEPYLPDSSTYNLDNFSQSTLVFMAINNTTIEANIYNWYLQLAD